MSQILQETISGNRVVKAFGMEGFEIRKFREASRKLLRENMRWVRAFLVTSPLMDMLGAAVLCMMLLYARGEIKVGRLTIGMFGAFAFALFKAYEPIKHHRKYLPALPAGAGNLHAGVFDSSICPKKRWTRRARKCSRAFRRSIEFDDVSFAYDDGPADSEKHRFEGSARARWWRSWDRAARARRRS